VNILDTFFFMFEADVSKVTKGTEAGEASAKKLKKAIDDVDMSADKLAANFVNMAKNAAGALAGVLALGAVKTLVNDTAAHTAAVGLQARAINMSVETMSAYQASIVTMGGTAEQATSTLSKLRDGFVEVARFGTMGVSPMTMAFQSLGASAQTMHDAIKDPTVALSAIADNFAKLDKTQQIFLGQRLGLDQGTIQLLAQGKRGFDEMIAKQRELHAITQAQADASIKYTIAQKELAMSFDAVKREIAMDLLPAFTWVVQHLDQMITWLREHKAVAVATFTAIGLVVGAVLVPPLITAAGALWALIAPVLAVAAPFVALGLAIGLVVDDIEKYRAGQKSLIGEIFEKWPAAGEIVKGVFKELRADLLLFLTTIKSVWDYLAAMLEFFATVLVRGPSAALDTLNQKVAAIGERLGGAFKNVFGGVKEVAHGVFDAWNHTMGRGEPQKSPSPETVAKLGPSTATGRQIADKLVSMGWTQEQAAGIAGSFMQESRGRADARNPTSGAYGLGQWLGSRRKDFEQWAGHPLEGSTLDEQLQFFQYEVTNGKEQSAGRRLRAATSAAEAADIHSKYYERPGTAEANLARREMFANQIFSARSQLAMASAAPLAQPGATVGGARSVQVTVGDINVHGANDPQATAKAVKDALAHHINNAIDQHDDGIAG
jgi:hypothetical protein